MGFWDLELFVDTKFEVLRDVYLYIIRIAEK